MGSITRIPARGRVGARRLRASPTREPVRSFNVEFVNHEELYIISNAPGFNSIWITPATGVL